MATTTHPPANSAFTILFNQEEYAVDLYKEVSGISLHPTQIKSVKLEEGLAPSRLYNDISFLTQCNKLLVLVEHQSTINPNMAFRLLEYFVRLASQYIKITRQDKYGTRQIELPQAELFVVYNGPGEMPQFPPLDLGDIKVTIKVKNIHFHRLADQSPNSAVAGYARLIDLAREMSIWDAMEIAAKEGYLKKFLQDEEAKNMFAEAFSYDNELLDAGLQQGIQQGIQLGLQQGIQEKALNMAKLALAEGLNINLIIKLTGLDAETIEAISQGRLN